MEGVVPLAVEVVSDQGAGERGHVSVGDLDAGGVGVGVEPGVDLEPGACGGRGGGVHDDFVGW